MFSIPQRYPLSIGFSSHRGKENENLYDQLQSDVKRRANCAHIFKDLAMREYYTLCISQTNSIEYRIQIY